MHPLQNALYVSVHHSYKLAEGNAGNRRRRVAADPRQGPQTFYAPGKLASMLLHDLLRRRMQHAGATVISQPAPGRQHRRLSCGSQPFDAREALQKSLIVIRNSRHASLLEHDFRKPDTVRIAIAPPGQIAFMAVKPA